MRLSVFREGLWWGAAVVAVAAWAAHGVWAHNPPGICRADEGEACFDVGGDAEEGEDYTKIDYDRGFVVYEGPEAEVCGQWILAPGFELWARPVQGILLFLFLAYLFLGIAIIADIFMVAIEVITSAEREVALAGSEKKVRVRVWNPTLANLSLMALGSSAPEILLSTIEAVTTLGEPAGALGSGTIVGSAAFNLLVIIAVCVIAPPPGESRAIADFGVFMITAVASIFAYVWFAIVLLVWTPYEVTIEEAVITFIFFPLLLFLAVGQDKNWWRKNKGEADPERLNSSEELGLQLLEENLSTVADLGDEVDLELKEHAHELREALASMRREGVPAGMTAEEYKRSMARALVHSIVEKKAQKVQVANSLLYRINGARRLTGQRRVLPNEQSKIDEEFYHDIFDEIGKVIDSASATEGDVPKTVALFQFEATKYRFLESAGKATVAVTRAGNKDGTVAVGYHTADGTAQAPADYTPTHGYLVFKPGEMRKTIEVAIIDDDEYELDEYFFLHLLPIEDVELAAETHVHGALRAAGKKDQIVDSDSDDGLDDSAVALSSHPNTIRPELPDDLTDGVELSIGGRQSCRVVIANDDFPSVIQFEKPEVECQENCGSIKLIAVRTGGTDGRVTVDFETSDGTAKSEEDYIAEKGTIVFEAGQASAEISIKIVDDDFHEEDEWFFVTMKKVSSDAAVLGHRKVKVTIHDDDDYADITTTVAGIVGKRAQRFSLATQSWRGQFSDALAVGGDADEDGEDLPPTSMDYVLHFLTVPWKVLFAIVPPPAYKSGWVTFWVALIFIGLVTAVVDQAARAFGCVVGLKDSVTAITIVALGTSLPDTFASRTAARMSPTADASITNVTGSNSVNVFLGLGLPWLISSIYWKIARSSGYPVPADGLAVGVIVFTVAAVLATALLVIRRWFLGGELGGAAAPRWMSAVALVIMWLTFVVVSTVQAYGGF